ncbi:hypothetical protein Hoch_1348 [Haliangium ochraceum DSM 14365]|uniref:Jacalin-type lectin domain-containing protein n=2 Tax=Haliangium ochraceum TaxID=80816 RepID=D0LTK9_HALO1|nr:hypothetical protein Hoch_1348 [Haliangium ochraceum DSM 14365]
MHSINHEGKKQGLVNRRGLALLALACLPLMACQVLGDAGGDGDIWEQSLQMSTEEIQASSDELLALEPYPTHPDATPARGAGGVDLRGIPSARSVAEAEANLQARIDRVLDFYIERKTLTHFPTNDDERGIFYEPALARVMRGIDGERINEILLDPATKQWAKYGSTFTEVPLFERYGDYDFTATGLIQLIYTDLRNHRLLSDAALDKLKTQLLPRGSSVYTHFTIAGIPIEDTENHILMTNISKYLNNQLLMDDPEWAAPEYDNAANGYSEWMLEHLKGFFVDGFDEYNSRPYQKYTVMAINNLASYADEPRVKLAATMLLDYLSATYSVQSNHSRRFPPFRRQDDYSQITRVLPGETEAARFAVLSGNYAALRGDQRPMYHESASYGGDGGGSFHDLSAMPEFPVVKKVALRSGSRVDGVEITLGAGYDDTIRHGGDGGSYSSLTLGSGEYIQQLEVQVGRRNGSDRVVRVVLTTNTGRILAGGDSTSTRYYITAPEGFQISGFHGRQGTEIDRLGAIFTPLDYLYEDNSMVSSLASNAMLDAAIHEYRVPPLLQHLIIREDHNTFFQTFKHGGVELYYSSENYLITAGGVFENRFMFGSKEQHGWAMPTTIMPSHDPGSDYRNWIRIKGNDWRMERYNHAVAKNFASGSNLQIPDSIPASCRESQGNWTFFDFASENCPLPYGFYVAVYRESCDSSECSAQGSNWGFFETREADEIAYADFRDSILRDNGSYNYRSNAINSYTSSAGEVIEFRGVQVHKTSWGISAINGASQQRDMNQWPPANGDIITATESGLVTIRNPFLQRGLVLDMRDPLNPSRQEFDL